MQALLQLINILLPLGYLLAVLNYLVLYRTESAWSTKTAGPLARSVVTLHALYLILLGATFQHVPIANVWEAFTFVTFALALIYLLLEWRLRNQATGVFLFVPALIFQVFSSAFITHTRDVEPLLRSSWFGLHVTTALLGYAALSIAAVYGILYVLLYRSLKGSRVGLVFRRVPSLDILGRLNISALIVGWINLTLAIIVGIVWVTGLDPSQRTTDSFVSDPKFLSTLIVWALYGVCLAGRFIGNWPSRHLATISMAAFVFMLLSSVAVSLFLETFHSFG